MPKIVKRGFCGLYADHADRPGKSGIFSLFSIEIRVIRYSSAKSVSQKTGNWHNTNSPSGYFNKTIAKILPNQALMTSHFALSTSHLITCVQRPRWL
jgi:hypothetical protein